MKNLLLSNKRDPVKNLPDPRNAQPRLARPWCGHAPRTGQQARPSHSGVLEGLAFQAFCLVASDPVFPEGFRPDVPGFGVEAGR